MKQILYVCMCYFLISCTSNTKKEYIPGWEADSFSSQEKNGIISLQMSSIDFNELKNEFREHYTSGILSKQETYNYRQPDENVFWGRYHFLNPPSIAEESSPIVGTAIIYTNEIPWKYDNQSDQLIELTVVDKGVRIWEEVEVGVSVEMLDSLLGEAFYCHKDQRVYTNLPQLTVASFRIKDEKIIWFRIGNYNTEIVEQPEQYLEFLFK